jgi:hypothetical protein
MSGIHARPTSGRLEDNINNGKDLRKEQFITGQHVGSGRRALDTIPLGVFLVANDIIEAGSDNNLVNLTAHGARKGDLLRINTSANGIIEFEVSVDEIVSANSFRLGAVLSAALATGDTVSILRPISQQMSATGATLATITPSPIIYNLDGVETEVNEDTVTPANNRPLPVKLMGVNGTLNLTANDLDISSSHTEDSIAIGDGVHLWDINASGEGLVKDADAATGLASLLTELQLKADLSETQPVSVASLPLPTGASTETTLAALLVELALKADLSETQPVSLASVPLPTGAATETTLASLLTELQLKADLSETQPVSLASVPLPTGAATEAKQDTQITSLGNIDTDLGAPGDAAVSNPASSASVIAALKGLMTLITSTNTKLDTLDVNTSANLDSVSNTVATANTLLTAPASARFMVVQNSTEALSALRFTPSGTTPSASVGFFLGPGQSTSMIPAGSIRTISFDGSAIDASVLWFV